MKWAQTAAIILASFWVTSEANADTVLHYSAIGPYISAPMLLSACLQDDPRIHCDPYIAGVADSITSNGGVFENSAICLTPDVSIDKLRSLVVKFIQSHPELPQGTIAASAVATAIMEGYPCAKRPPTL